MEMALDLKLSNLNRLGTLQVRFLKKYILYRLKSSKFSLRSISYAKQRWVRDPSYQGSVSLMGVIRSKHYQPIRCILCWMKLARPLCNVFVKSLARATQIRSTCSYCCLVQ